MSTNPAEPDDTALLRRVADGDEAAFEVLFNRWSGLVHMHCVRQLGTTQGADDQVAVVFLEAWRRRKDIRVVNGRAIAWLLVTATNVCRNDSRSRRRYRAALSRIPEPHPEPDHAESVADSAVSQIASTALAEGLSKLNTTDRHVLSLCLLNDMTYAEAAEALSLSHAAVRSRLSRARSQLREHLEGAGFASEGGELMDQLTLTPEERHLLDVTAVPLAPARRLQLADFVMAEIHDEPRRTRRRTFGFLAAILAALTLTGGVAYAWIATTQAPSDRYVAYCHRDTSDPDRNEGWVGTSITAVARVDGTNKPTIDAVTTCAEQWYLGVVHAPGVTPTRDVGNPVPELTACVDREGAAAVFPADASICTRLGLPSLR